MGKSLSAWLKNRVICRKLKDLMAKQKGRITVGQGLRHVRSHGRCHYSFRNARFCNNDADPCLM